MASVIAAFCVREELRSSKRKTGMKRFTPLHDRRRMRFGRRQRTSDLQLLNCWGAFLTGVVS
jgi:hypothetical protein